MFILFISALPYPGQWYADVNKESRDGHARMMDVGGRENLGNEVALVGSTSFPNSHADVQARSRRRKSCRNPKNAMGYRDKNS